VWTGSGQEEDHPDGLRGATIQQLDVSRSPFRRRRGSRTRLRAVIGIALITSWSLVVVSGLVLWAAPDGPRSCRRVLLLGFLKREWADVHLWLSLGALAVTAAHVVVDWRMFCSAMRSLVRPPSGPR
jgi:hypothetical protein